jgi:CIC family chloride channel protein
MTKSRLTYIKILSRLRRILKNEHLVLSVLGLIVGCGTGTLAVIFREAIHFVDEQFFRAESDLTYNFAANLPWWQILAIPSFGGLIVGILTYNLMPNKHPQGVADVIEANALKEGKMPARTGLISALSSIISIGVGASVGREGPAVHLGATLSSLIAGRLHLSRSLTRTILGCGVGAAVAASFNAPIAGVLFASEVVVGHYALKSFAPIVIASVAGTAISRSHFGDFPAFVFDANILASFWEFPAFVILGICAGVAAIIFMRFTFIIEGLVAKLPLPQWLLPAFGGLIIGIIAIFFPQILGVGYGITEAALLTKLSLTLLITIGLLKILATAVSIGFGFSGGVFSPALIIGAMVGSSFGIIATMIFPEHSSGPAAYTIVGMGAVAASVLGAPISTTLIIFEMTKNYALTMAVMLAVVISTEITYNFFSRSFFSAQLKRRGIDVKEGFESEIMRSKTISEVLALDADTINISAPIQDLRTHLQHSVVGELFVLNLNGELHGTVTLADLRESAFDHTVDDLVNAGDVSRLNPPTLTLQDNLESALALMNNTGEEHIAVIEGCNSLLFKGCVHQRDLMAAYNQALLKTRHEEHGE